MRLVLDTHWHLHPAHDLRFAFSSLLRNLSRLAPGGDTQLIAFLTDRAGGTAYRRLRDGALLGGTDLDLEYAEDDLCIVSGDEGRVRIHPACQIASVERLELLGLGMGDDGTTTGHDIHSLVSLVHAAGGLPVMPWSAGRWRGKRGAVVREALRAFRSHELLLGDVTHRPSVLPDHPFFTSARAEGRTILCGSDPLPVAGEEVWGGAYGSTVDWIQPHPPSLADLLAFLAGGAELTTRGRRSDPVAAALRLLRHRARGGGAPAGNA